MIHPTCLCMCLCVCLRESMSMCFNVSLWLWEKELNWSNLDSMFYAFVGKAHQNIYILSVTSLPKSPGVPLPSDRNPSGELQPTWMPSPPSPLLYNKASWTREILLETFEVGLNEWKKRKCHQFHLRRFQIESLTMKVHQREMQTPQSSKGTVSCTFRVIKELNIDRVFPIWGERHLSYLHRSNRTREMASTAERSPPPSHSQQP